MNDVWYFKNGLLVNHPKVKLDFPPGGLCTFTDVFSWYTGCCFSWERGGSLTLGLLFDWLEYFLPSFGYFLCYEALTSSCSCCLQLSHLTSGRGFWCMLYGCFGDSVEAWRSYSWSFRVLLVWHQANLADSSLALALYSDNDFLEERNCCSHFPRRTFDCLEWSCFERLWRKFLVLEDSQAVSSLSRMSVFPPSLW